MKVKMLSMTLCLGVMVSFAHTALAEGMDSNDLPASQPEKPWKKSLAGPKGQIGATGQASVTPTQGGKTWETSSTVTGPEGKCVNASGLGRRR